MQDKPNEIPQNRDEINNINQDKDGPTKPRRKLSDLLNDVLRFWILLFLIMGSAIGIYYVLNDFSFGDYDFIFHILWYPLAITCVIIWIKVIKKEKIRPYLLHKPKIPEKHHRWFYIVYSIFFIGFVSGWVVLLKMGAEYAYIDYPIPLLIVGLTHSCIGAPIVEEILFRGYWYTQSEKVWEKDGWYINWNGIELNNKTKQTNQKRIMQFEITYAALFTSFLFGIWHLNLYQAFYTFFGGLFFVKTKREWGETLVAPMILHSTWNFIGQIFIFTAFPILEDLMHWFLSLI